MIGLETGFEALGRPFSRANERIDSVIDNTACIFPVVDDGKLRLAYGVPNQSVELVEYGTGSVDSRNIHVVLPDGSITKVFGYVGRDSVDCMLAATVINEQCAGTIFLVGAESRLDTNTSLRINADSVNLLYDGSDRARQKISTFWTVYPHRANSSGVISDDEYRNNLIRLSYSATPTKIGAALATALVKAASLENGSELSTADFTRIRHEMGLDPVIKHAIEAPEGFADLADRAILTRYLLNQLTEDSPLYGNELAIADAQTLLGKGVLPISFDELADVVNAQAERHFATNKYL